MTPQFHNCLQCGSVGTVIEHLAFHQGHAGEWYQCCTKCKNIHFPPQPGTSPHLVKAIEAARTNSSILSSAPSLHRHVRGASAPALAESARRVSRFEVFIQGIFLNLDVPTSSASGPSQSAGATPCAIASLNISSSHCNDDTVSMHRNAPGGPRMSETALLSPLDQCITSLNNEMLARGLQALLDAEGVYITKQHHAQDVQHLAALNIAGPSKKPRALNHSDKMLRALAELAAKPCTLELLIKEFLELTKGMGVPITMPSCQLLSMQEHVTQGLGADEDKESVVDTATPATRKRRFNAYIVGTLNSQVPRVKVAPARQSTSVHIPLPHRFVIKPRMTHDIIEISSSSEDDNDDTPTVAQTASHQASVILLMDLEHASLGSEHKGPTHGSTKCSIHVCTPFDVIKLMDLEESGDEVNGSKKNTTSSGLNISIFTCTHQGLLASHSPTCLTDLLPSDSSQSETTDLFAEDVEDDDPHILCKSKPSNGNPVKDFVLFGDIYCFEIYPSLANLTDGPLLVFNQATQWMLTVKIWYDLPPATKMIMLDDRHCKMIMLDDCHCKIILARYHIVHRIFNGTQNPSTTDWHLHAATAPLEVSVEPGFHTLLIHLPFVMTLITWAENIGQTYGTCTTVQHPSQKGKGRAHG
ncbi:hypothetical protein V8D89_014115 [Ganoderma adspersum]